MSNKRLLHQLTPESSAIERIGYNSLTQELFILFNKNGQWPEYVFGGVDSAMAKEFMNARSKGSYYNRRIKGRSAFSVTRAFGSFRLGAVRRRIRNVFSRRR